MEKKSLLYPFCYEFSQDNDDRNILNSELQNRKTRDENAGGTRSDTHGLGLGLGKRTFEQEDDNHKRRLLETSSAQNSDSIITSDDSHFNVLRSMCKQLQGSALPSSESVYNFKNYDSTIKIPSSPPVPSSPQLDPIANQLFASQATIVPDIESDDSSDTVNFNINSLNKVQGYISSDFQQSESFEEEDENEEEKKIIVKGIFAKCVEDGQDQVHLDQLNLKYIPDEIEDLKNLVVDGRNGIEVPNLHIYATHNKLKILPPTLFNVEIISVLSLRDNRLKKIPSNIIKLQNLTYLNVSQNEIKVLPYQILQLPKLTNLLVRPNSNLIELDKLNPSSFYRVNDEDPNHEVDLKRCVSKIKWSDSLIASSQLDLSSQSSITNDREMLNRVSGVPKLTELALRRISGYGVTRSESNVWKRVLPIHIQRKLTKALQKGAYGEVCSVCNLVTVDPIAKSLEWWDFKEQSMIPVRRNFCCGNCVKVWLDDVDESLKRFMGVMDLEKGVKSEENNREPGEEEEIQEVRRVIGLPNGQLRFDENF